MSVQNQCAMKSATYENGTPEATEPLILPAPEDVEHAQHEHQNTEHYEQPPGARFLVIDLHFLDHDDFRSHGGDGVGRLVSPRRVKAASDERRRANLLCGHRRLRVRPVAVRVDHGGAVDIGGSMIIRDAAVSTPEQQAAATTWSRGSFVQRSTVVVETNAVVAVHRAAALRRIVNATHSIMTTGQSNSTKKAAARMKNSVEVRRAGGILTVAAVSRLLILLDNLNSLIDQYQTVNHF